MKELSIEQKARRYDEALERAKELLEVGLKDTRDKRVVLSFFPELAESDDERIRKEIISMFETLDRKDWIAWLGKQGEQKPADTEKGAKGNDREIPNSAWSEEDEKVLDNILYILNQLKDTTPHKEDETAKECIDKLKSLKERCTWKPSDAQMVALDGICSYIRNKADWEISQDMVSDLYKLSEQLKKLKD